MDFSFIVIIIQLIFLEGILSIDNAAILGAMVSTLPENDPIPWPKSLHWLAKILDKPLGHQRVAALRVGLLGAYVGRGLMLFAASYIVQNPWLRMIGAIYLIRLAVDDLSAHGYNSEDEEMKPVKVRSFWATVLAVELMDLVFSLDNVVAAVSLSDELWVIFIGVFIGILVMRFAAGIFSYVVQREPILKTAAYMLVFNIGVELLLEEFMHIEINTWVKFGISIITLTLCIAYAHLKFLHIFRPMLVWISQGMAIINQTISWAMAPLSGIFYVIKMIFAKRPAATGESGS
jgi:tellurite resistance protein TerC